MIFKKTTSQHFLAFLSLLFMANTQFAEEITPYTVYFWKIPCADIEMVLSSGKKKGEKELVFTTQTRDFLSYFFYVKNSYKTLFDTKNFQMIRYEKRANQSNMEHKMEIIWNPKKSVYQADTTGRSAKKIEYPRPSGTHNIFSLLMRARAMPKEKLDTQKWITDHEGQFYICRFLWIDSAWVKIGRDSVLTDHWRLDFIPAEEKPHDKKGKSIKLVEITDVFSWGITREDCVRQIWVERSGSRRIARAEVQVGGWRLMAKVNG